MMQWTLICYLGYPYPPWFVLRISDSLIWYVQLRLPRLGV